MTLRLPEVRTPFHSAMRWLLRRGPLWTAISLLVVAAAFIVAPSFLELVKTGATYEHWSRFIAAATFVSIAVTLLVTRVLDYSLDLIADRLAYLASQGWQTDAATRTPPAVARLGNR